MMQPPGSRPGVRNLAIAPTIRPMISVQRIALIIPIRVTNLVTHCNGSIRRSCQISQLDNLSAVDVFAGIQSRRAVRRRRRGVKIKNGQRAAAGLVSAERHGGDVDAVIA